MRKIEKNFQPLLSIPFFHYNLILELISSFLNSIYFPDLSFCLSVCLSIWLSVYLSVCLSFCLPVCLFVCLCIYLLPLGLSFSPTHFIPFSFYFSFSVSISLSFCVSVTLIIPLSLNTHSVEEEDSGVWSTLEIRYPAPRRILTKKSPELNRYKILDKYSTMYCVLLW